ncbi:hypothetical protein GGR89_000120 [Sphingomonas trueperi]|uniref:Uncharacterized protein n=1 Tax=Sphingomonas trueperi TaxID=53317 RepID=A0A7X5XUZ0_9SPHN|nr:hypothetical protein [Sphingomonas trueperi]
MDGLSLSLPAAARRRAPPPAGAGLSTRVDRTTSTVDSTLRSTDRS